MAWGSQLMMVPIYTSVWIDFFAGRQLPHVTSLERLIKGRKDICICGIFFNGGTSRYPGKKWISKNSGTFQYHDFFADALFSFFGRSANLWDPAPQGNYNKKFYRLHDSISCNRKRYNPPRYTKILKEQKTKYHGQDRTQ